MSQKKLSAPSKTTKKVVAPKDPSPEIEDEIDNEIDNEIDRISLSESVKSSDNGGSDDDDSNIDSDKEDKGEIEFLLTEGSKFKQYLMSSNLFSQTLYFLFEKESLTIYLKDESDQEPKKGTKKGKKRDTRISGNCTFNTEIIQYRNTFEKQLCLSVEIPDLTSHLKAVNVGVQLQFIIRESDLSFINVVPGFPGRLSITGLMQIKARPIEFSECKISTLSIPAPQVSKICLENDLWRVLTSITNIGKDVGNSNVRVYEKGYVIQTTTQRGTQLFSLQLFDADKEPITSVEITRSLIDVLKKMQIKKGSVRINYYSDGNYRLGFNRSEGPMAINIYI